MDFRDVCRVFGGTPFYDDLHTDLVVAHSTLEARAAAVPTTSVEQGLPVILLRAIFDLLQGDFVSAKEKLDSLSKHGLSPAQGPRWTFRKNVYSALLCVWRDFPPLLQPCDLRGPALTMWMNRKGHDDGAHFLATCAQHEQEMSELDILEYKVIRAICTSFYVIRAIRGLHGRPFDRDFDLSWHKRQYSRLLDLFTQINRLIENSLHFNLPLIATYLLRTQYDLARASGWRFECRSVPWSYEIHLFCTPR
jgi:hypothetical protein